VDEVADGVVLELLRHRHQNHTGLPQFADIHLDHELIAEESRHRVHQDQVKRASGRGGGVNHALKLGPTVISGGSSSFDERLDQYQPARRTRIPTLPNLVGYR
jgi:hypothetical protein